MKNNEYGILIFSGWAIAFFITANHILFEVQHNGEILEKILITNTCEKEGEYNRIKNIIYCK